MNKTYTFFIDKKNNTVNNNVSNTTSNSAYIDAIIRSNVKKAAPYAFDTIDEDYHPTIVINGTKPAKKTIDIDITIKKNKPTYTSLDFSKYSEFKKALDFILSYDNYDDSADFYLPDGTPVRIFDDEIQIGYELIPMRMFSEKKYNSLSKKTKKAIIDLYINISK